MSSLVLPSTTEVYNKTSKILAAIEICGCIHCLSILKSGLGNQPNPAQETTPAATRNGQEDIR
jgi:hypothetical protein